MSLERDPIKDLDKRVIASGGVGRDIWNTPRLGLGIQLGLGFITEEVARVSESGSVAQWVLRYRQDLFNEDLDVYVNNSIVHYLSGRANTIYKTSTGLRYEITDLLYATGSLDYDYEAQPAPGATAEDLTLLFGFGVEF